MAGAAAAAMVVVTVVAVVVLPLRRIEWNGKAVAEGRVGAMYDANSALMMSALLSGKCGLTLAALKASPVKPFAPYAATQRGVIKARRRGTGPTQEGEVAHQDPGLTAAGGGPAQEPAHKAKASPNLAAGVST